MFDKNILLGNAVLFLNITIKVLQLHLLPNLICNSNRTKSNLVILSVGLHIFHMYKISICHETFVPTRSQNVIKCALNLPFYIKIIFHALIFYRYFLF